MDYNYNRYFLDAHDDAIPVVERPDHPPCYVLTLTGIPLHDDNDAYNIRQLVAFRFFINGERKDAEACSASLTDVRPDVKLNVDAVYSTLAFDLMVDSLEPYLREWEYRNLPVRLSTGRTFARTASLAERRAMWLYLSNRREEFNRGMLAGMLRSARNHAMVMHDIWNNTHPYKKEVHELMFYTAMASYEVAVSCRKILDNDDFYQIGGRGM